MSLNGAEMTSRATSSGAAISSLAIQRSLSRRRLASGAPRAAGAGTPQQIVVELATTDPVADGTAERRGDLGGTQHARAKPGDRLDHAATGVIVDVDLEFLQDRRSNPARTDFVAGKFGLVENDHVETRPAKRARMTNRPGPHRRSARRTCPFVGRLDQKYRSLRNTE